MGEERRGGRKQASDYYVVVFFLVCIFGGFFGVFAREWPGHSGGGLGITWL